MGVRVFAGCTVFRRYPRLASDKPMLSRALSECIAQALRSLTGPATSLTLFAESARL